MHLVFLEGLPPINGNEHLPRDSSVPHLLHLSQKYPRVQSPSTNASLAFSTAAQLYEAGFSRTALTYLEFGHARDQGGHVLVLETDGMALELHRLLKHQRESKRSIGPILIASRNPKIDGQTSNFCVFPSKKDGHRDLVVLSAGSKFTLCSEPDVPNCSGFLSVVDHTFDHNVERFVDLNENHRQRMTCGHHFSKPSANHQFEMTL